MAWDLPPGATAGEERFRTRHRRSGPVTRLRLRPGTAELLSSQFNDPAVLVWNVETGEPNRRVKLGSRDRGSVRDFGPGPRGETLVALPPEGPPGVWELTDGSLRRHFEGHEGDVLTLALDGERLATGGADGTVRQWRISSGEPVRLLAGLDASVKAVALRRDLVAAAAGGTVMLWNAETGVEQARLHLLSGGRWAAITPDGRWDAARDGDLPELPVRTETPDGPVYSLLSDHPEHRRRGLLGSLPEP